MRRPKVSVITACYNTSQFVIDCINSVQRSITLDEFELEHIVVDDNSSDNSRELIKQSDSPYLKKIFLQENNGISASRDIAIRQSDSDYIFVLDADDVIFQNSLRYLLEVLVRDSSNWAYGDFLRCNQDLSYTIGDDYYGWPHKNFLDVIEAIYTGVHFFQQNSMYSRDLFLRVGGFDQNLSYAEDTDLLTRFLLAKLTPIYLPSPLYLHRNHNHNVSIPLQQDPLLQKKALYGIYRKYQHEIEALLESDRLDKINSYFADLQ